MHDICWRYGIQIQPFELSFLDNSIGDSISHLKALSIPKGKGRRGTIYIKPDMNAVERKIILAEEFCHLYTHHPQMAMNKCVLAKTENQAKRMAAYLLMPARFFKDIFSAALDGPVLISEIADYFVVTEEFAQYRLKLVYNRKIDAFLTPKGKLGTV
jgi:Zn-dependent peptidase ImmA (M78 family)